MQELAAFIDLNTYRMTNAMLAEIYSHCQNYEKVNFYFYNYSVLLHKALNLKGKTFPTLSGRRKVQIDIRIICDTIEYVCLNSNADVMLLCGTIDAEPFFEKLKNLNIKTTFVTMQKVNIGASDYLVLTRNNSYIEHHELKPKIDNVKTYLKPEKTIKTISDDYDSKLEELNLLINQLKF